MLGSAEPRGDAEAKLRGAARYPDDLAEPTDLVAQVVFSRRPHARLLELDVRDAIATPGCVAVFTAEDVPHNAYGLVTPDQPVLVGAVASGTPDAATRSRWEGDHIALVVAESRASASRAAERIRAVWEDLPVLGDLDTAAQSSTRIHPERTGEDNVLGALRLEKGDPAAGWRAAEVTVQGTYVVPRQEHAFLQPEAARSYVDDAGRVTVEIAGQWAHRDRAQIASALGLGPDRVRVRYPTIGGAFGGREDVSLQIVMALAAWRLAARGERRPVRARWSREESIRGHGKSPWMRIATRWGATRAGRITAVEASVDLDAGAYDYTGEVLLHNALSFLGGCYDVPHAQLEGRAVYTNNVPAAAFRGFGAPQACFAVEGQINKLASALGLDPVAVRRRNALRADGTDITGARPAPGYEVGPAIDACQRAVARRPRAEPDATRTANGFSALPPDPAALRRGRGLAVGIKNIGYSFGTPERSEIGLELEGGATVERVLVRCSAAEVGQGAHTAIRQMTATALGVPVGVVELGETDTAAAGDAGSASASRLTVMVGRAVQEAAARALDAWRRGDRPARSHACYTAAATAPLGRGTPHLGYGSVAEAVELDVDVETGAICIQRIVCADDLGRVINPVLATGQIEGALAQALGGALLEDLRIEGGRIQNPRLSEYRIPAIGDVPPGVEAVLVETPHPAGPWHARGVGEMPVLPLAAAIAAALHDATGVWFDELPLTPERVRAALQTRAPGR